jgi:hypothetical protein
MERKFKLGDTVICPTADIPAPCTIIGIDHDQSRYVYTYTKAGEVHAYTRFVDEHKWELYKPSTSITKADILDLMQTVTKQTGKKLTNTGVHLSDQLLNKLYNEWKQQLQDGNDISTTN